MRNTLRNVLRYRTYKEGRIFAYAPEPLRKGVNIICILQPHAFVRFKSVHFIVTCPII